MHELNVIHNLDCIEGMRQYPDRLFHCCVTSPPYWGLRDYGVEGQIGLEESPDAFIEKMVEVFREVKRVLRDDGTLWVNIGDSYATPAKKRTPEQAIRKSGLNSGFASQMACKDQPNKLTNGYKAKDLVGIPWMLAFALRADGWYLRQDIIWSKPNPMPESVTDRCTKSHEYLFLLTKSAKYCYNQDAIKEQASPNTHARTRNKRSVWTITPQAFKEAHFATFPEELPHTCIQAGCPPDGVVLDPFMGAGTTALVARKLDRKYVGFELKPEYIQIAGKRLQEELGMFK